MKILLKFLQGSTGDFSSKRLMGVMAGSVFAMLSIVGCYLFRHDHETFKDILWALNTYSAALLGAGLFEKRNDNTTKINSMGSGTPADPELESEDLSDLPEEVGTSRTNGKTNRRAKKQRSRNSDSE